MSLVDQPIVVTASVLHVDTIETRTGRDGTVYPARMYVYLWDPGTAPERVKVPDELWQAFNGASPGDEVTVEIASSAYQSQTYYRIAKLVAGPAAPKAK